MKHAVALLATTLLAVAEKPAAGLADLEHPKHACLWKIEGKGLETPSWLFGTIHLADAQVTALHPKAEVAFDGADAVYTEIKLDAAAQLELVPLMMRKDGKTLSQSIGEELAAAVNAELQKINPALSVAPFETLKTWALAVMLPLLELQMNGQQPLDAVLYQRAQGTGKSVGGLETPEEQVATFDQFEEKDQITFLSETLRMMKEDRANDTSSLERLRAVYLTKAADGIAEVMKAEMARMDEHKELAERFMKALLDDRNVRMADRIAGQLGKNPGQSYFFGVGAGHYADETGIQELLAKKGYKVTPMFE